MNNDTRPLAMVVTASLTVEGGGFEVYRPFPAPQLNLLDPFLLLDEMGPTVNEPGRAVGAPDHPHRGFETITYILEGEVEHRDSAGNHGVIGPGDIQWMTAGDGVVHSEMPTERAQSEGGRAHGMQLWVNLPRELKRTAPRYQALTADNLAEVSGDGWSARVVAGDVLGGQGPAATHTPVGYAHLTVQPGATVRIPVPDAHSAALYAFSGSALAGTSGEELAEHALAVFERTSGDMLVEVPAESEHPLESLVLTGQPLNEPVARYGPFVMNTRAEIEEAIEDFQAGRMGTIAATGTV